MSNLDVFDLFNRDYSREQLETMSLRDGCLPRATTRCCTPRPRSG